MKGAFFKYTGEIITNIYLFICCQLVFTGLVANVYPVEKLVEESIKKAEKIASQSQMATKMAKEAVNKGMCELVMLLKIMYLPCWLGAHSLSHKSDIGQLHYTVIICWLLVVCTFNVWPQSGQNVLLLAYEMGLAQGLQYERRLFHATFATVSKEYRCVDLK